MQKIILASQSPRRKQLLEWAEVPFEIITQETLEQIPEGVPVEEVPIHIAREKANAVRAKIELHKEGYNSETGKLPIVAADTLVVLDNDIIGKPHSRDEAIKTLTRLQGKTHRVITGVVIMNGENEEAFSDITTVAFHPLTQEQIAFYVDKYSPYDKAGAYAIQEWIGVVGIKSIDGDFYNVMGLPVSRVVQFLQKL